MRGLKAISEKNSSFDLRMVKVLQLKSWDEQNKQLTRRSHKCREVEKPACRTLGQAPTIPIVGYTASRFSTIYPLCGQI
jgi:hypothetical protein